MREEAPSSRSQTGPAGSAGPLRLALACAPRIPLGKEEGAGGGAHREPEGDLEAAHLPFTERGAKPFTCTPDTNLVASFVGR